MSKKTFSFFGQQSDEHW